MQANYHRNALGKNDPLVAPHSMYQELATTREETRASYQQILSSSLDDTLLKEIRFASNHAWVLGNKKFQQKIEKGTKRQSSPRPKGGKRRT